jgi:hypothetical protein
MAYLKKEAPPEVLDTLRQLEAQADECWRGPARRTTTAESPRPGSSGTRPARLLADQRPQFCKNLQDDQPWSASTDLNQQQ